MTVELLVFSHVVLDDVHFSSGESHIGVLGGAGTYAAMGAAAIARDFKVGVVSGIGWDFPQAQRDWLNRAGIDAAGLTLVDEHTPLTRIDYADDGERVETPAFGLEHFALSEPSINGLPLTYGAPRGVYIFKPLDADFWTDLDALRQRTGCSVLWEIDAAACTPDQRSAVLEQLKSTTLFTLNETELRALFADEPATSDDDLLSELLEAGPEVVILRRGSRGARAYSRVEAWEAAPVPVDVVDPTGAGNAFSGAFLASWIERQNLHDALLSGMAAAALAIRQRGPAELDQGAFLTLASTIASLRPQRLPSLHSPSSS